MNRQIVRLTYVSLALVGVLVVMTTYWQAWAAPGLANRQDNAIKRVAEFSVDRGLVFSGQQAFKAVVADVHEVVAGGQLAGLDGAAARQAADDREAPRQRSEQIARLARHPGVGGALDDRGERAVDIAEHRRPRRGPPQRREQLGDVVSTCGGRRHCI